MVKIDDVKEAIEKLAKKKIEAESRNRDYVTIHYSELAKYLNITPVYALTWLKAVCDEYGRYTNGKCIIYIEDLGK